MTTIIVAVVLILSALTGGIYYYQRMDSNIDKVTQIQNIAHPEYLSDMVISLDTIHKIFSKYLKGVRAEEKLRQSDKNNITRIVNVKFTASQSNYAVIFKDSVSVFTNDLNLSVDKSNVKEYINDNGIRLNIVNRPNKGNLVLPHLLNVTEELRPTHSKGQKSGKIENIGTNPYDPIDIYGYINNGKILIYSTSTLSFINTGIKSRKDREFLSIMLPVLQKIRSQIQKEQLEKINNIPF